MFHDSTYGKEVVDFFNKVKESWKGEMVDMLAGKWSRMISDVLKLASDYGRLDFGQTAVIIRTFYATKKGDRGMPYKRVRGFVMWSKGRRRPDGSRDVAFGRASKAELIASYAMDPPPPAERVEFIG